MWTDLQDSFFIAFGPVIYYLILPGLLAGGLLLAIVRFVRKLLGGPRRHDDA